MQSPRRSIWLRYAIAVLVTFGALGLKFLLVPLLTKNQPALMFLAAVMVAAAFGGFGPGLVATLLGALCDVVYFMPPFGRLQLNTVDEKFRAVVFILEGVFVSIICARMKEAQRRAEENATGARELQRQLMDVSDAEQRRIGHDLHDGLGQHLTGIALMSKRLEEMLKEHDAGAALEASRLCELAKSAVEWTRDLSHTLSSPTLELEGLPVALAELAAQATTIFRVDCTFEERGEAMEVEGGDAVHLYRIAQEAIINAVRHGKAKRVGIELEYAKGQGHFRAAQRPPPLPSPARQGSPQAGVPGEGEKAPSPIPFPSSTALTAGENRERVEKARGIVLRVTDDGSGILPSSDAGDGMGLKLMRYRASVIGASMEIARGPAGGTIITCRCAPAGQMNDSKLWKAKPPTPPHEKHGFSWSKTTPSSARD